LIYGVGKKERAEREDCEGGNRKPLVRWSETQKVGEGILNKFLQQRGGGTCHQPPIERKCGKKKGRSTSGGKGEGQKSCDCTGTDGGVEYREETSSKSSGKEDCTETGLHTSKYKKNRGARIAARQAKKRKGSDKQIDRRKSVDGWTTGTKDVLRPVRFQMESFAVNNELDQRKREKKKNKKGGGRRFIWKRISINWSENCPVAKSKRGKRKKIHRALLPKRVEGSIQHGRNRRREKFHTRGGDTSRKRGEGKGGVSGPLGKIKLWVGGQARFRRSREKGPQGRASRMGEWPGRQTTMIRNG